jgi:hypothetical protein
MIMLPISCIIGRTQEEYLFLQDLVSFFLLNITRVEAPEHTIHEYHKILSNLFFR